MRILLPELLEGQKKDINVPSVRVDLQGFSPRVAFAYNQFDKLYWVSAYSDSTNISYHGCTMPADGSLVRVRCETGAASLKLYTQRVASPTTSSTFTSWTEREITGAGNIFPRSIAITSYGTEVYIFWLGYYDSPQDWCLAYIKSTNSGASFGSLVYQKIYDIDTGNSLPKSIAACHNGATAFVVYSYTNEAGAWNWGYAKEAESDFTIGYGYTDTVTGLSCYYGNDYNVVGLVTDSDGNSRLAMNIRGNGGDVTADTWYGWNYLDLSVAGTKKATAMSQYIQSIPSLVNQDGIPFGDDYYKQLDIALKFIQRLPYNPFGNIVIPEAPLPNREIPAYRSEWLSTTFVQQLTAALNISFNSPFICEPKTGHAPILSITKENTAWFYRLKPSTDFINAQWTEAFTLPLLGVTYGCAITTDGSDYMWLSRPNQVWRARIPGYMAAPTITSTYGLQDYHNDSTAVDTGWQTITTVCYGLYYKPSSAYPVRYIRLKLYRVGEPGTLTLRFDNDFAGTEKPVTIPYSATVNGDNVTDDTDGEYVQFDLGEEATVAPAKYLFIGLEALAGDGANYIRWQFGTANAPFPTGYDAGSYYYSSSAAV